MGWIDAVALSYAVPLHKWKRRASRSIALPFFASLPLGIIHNNREVVADAPC